jgi:hypothetical protein
VADDDSGLWYQDADWSTEDGKFDHEAVFEAIAEADRNEAFWEWFAEQYG